MHWSGAVVAAVPYCCCFSSLSISALISLSFYECQDCIFHTGRPKIIVVVTFPFCRITHSTSSQWHGRNWSFHTQTVSRMLFHFRICCNDADAGKYSISNTWLVFKRIILLLCYVACDRNSGPLFSGQNCLNRCLYPILSSNHAVLEVDVFLLGSKSEYIPFRSHNERGGMQQT